VVIERTVPTLTVISSARAAPALPIAMAAHANRVRCKVIRLSLIRAASALLCLDEIAALAVAIEAILSQRVDRQHDLTPIAAAHCCHQLLEEFRPVGERRLDCREPRPGIARRFPATRLDAGAGAEAAGQGRTRPGARADSPPGRI